MKNNKSTIVEKEIKNEEEKKELITKKAKCLINKLREYKKVERDNWRRFQRL